MCLRCVIFSSCSNIWWYKKQKNFASYEWQNIEIKVSNDEVNVIGMTWPHDGGNEIKTLGKKVPNNRRTGCSPNLKAKLI